MAHKTNDRLVKNISGCEEQYFQIGQKVIYEEKDAQIIKIKPFLVIKAGEKVVCGALQKIVRVYGDVPP
jgi:hypothetical protein